MKNLETQIVNATKQYGISLKKSLVTYGTIILYCNSSNDMIKISEVLSSLKAKIVVNESDLTVGVVF